MLFKMRKGWIWIIVIIVLILLALSIVFIGNTKEETQKGAAITEDSRINQISESEFDVIDNTDDVLSEIDESLEFFE